MKTRRGPCRHCRKTRDIRARGLCPACYARPEIKALYPPLQEQAPRPRDETMEDLDRLVAQQMQNLPPWWDEDGNGHAPRTVEPGLRRARKKRRKSAQPQQEESTP